MKDNLFAYTTPSGTYPGYLSISRTDSGDVEVTVRSAPTERKGIYVCANRCDRGKPGRCFPGDDTCNNYCNMAPQKGPMQDHPLPCDHVDAGQTASFVMPGEEWERLLASAGK